MAKFPFLSLIVLFCCILQISQGRQHTTRKIIHTTLAPSLPTLFSQAVQVDDLVYVSGYIGIDVSSILAVGIENQTRQTLNNIGHILRATKSGFGNVIQVTVHLTDIANFDAMNAVYGEFFTDRNHLPARSAYQISSLPRGALVEISVVAIAGDFIDLN